MTWAMTSSGGLALLAMRRLKESGLWSICFVCSVIGKMSFGSFSRPDDLVDQFGSSARGAPLGRERNLYFGGVQARRHATPESAAVSGVGDPRRGGAARSVVE